MPSIRTPDDAPDVVTAIKYLYSNRLHTDFTFISRDGRVKHEVHKLIVAIHSPVLAKLLYGNKPIDSLQVKYDENLALRNFVSFLYNDDLDLENISDIKQTKDIADRYEVKKLSEICKYELTNIPVNKSDVLSILETAIEFQNEKKENECLRLISENQEEIFTSIPFLTLPFRRVLDIFEKIKKMNRITDATFLRVAVRWMDTNQQTNSKDLLMEKVDVTLLSLDEYLSIIEDFPVFFSSNEISYASKQIRSRCGVQTIPKVTETKVKKKEYRTFGTNTEFFTVAETTTTSKNKTDQSKEELVANVEFFKEELSKTHESYKELEKRYDLLVIQSESVNIENDRQATQIKELEQTVKKLRERNDVSSPMSSLSYTSLDSKQKHLSIQILNQDDGVNVFELEKRARITIQEGCTIRSLQVAVGDVLKKGLIGTVAEKKGNYSESDVDITYEGLYFMLRSLKQLDETLSSIQYIEVLKAALWFQLKDVAEQCIKRISGIIDYDPVFLDGLRALSYLKDKCLGLKGLSEFKDKYIALLLSEPLRVILHPNFTKCSVDLIMLLLQQSELKVKDECQLLLVVIAWLEAHKEARRLFRTTLLKNLAFQNISTADFRYAIIHYPNFFDEKEQKLILAFRNAVGNEVKFFRDNLPDWYSTKTRKHI